MKYVHSSRKNELHLGNIGRGISICLLTAASPSLFANPQDGIVSAGSASIKYGQTTIVTQTSNRAVVNWKDFSINQNEATKFNVPSSKSVTLNRVTGGNVSHIMGTLTSNGQVFLVNPNGIVFGKTARVDVAGLVASTADIKDSDFMAGNYHFTNAPAGSKIINEGNITVRGAGLAALVAPHVENRGIIQAQLGRVALASGSAFTVDLYGDNLITFDASSTVKGSVDNIGRIEANGGTVMLSVAAAEGIVENVVNTSGYISATTVLNHNGKIVLQGYQNSTITVSGTVDASGKEKGQTGGVIQASADYVQLLNGSFLDASGDAGGGNVHIGSDVFHNPGDNPNINTLGLPTALRTAQFVYAAPDAVVHADSLHTGNAGNVVVWGDQASWFYGSISAAAKGLSGDGGRIETSGKYLDVAGININASSLRGKSGVWLLDPINITISNVVTSAGTFTGGNPSSYTPDNLTSPSNVYYFDIQNILTAGTSVIISTSLGSFAGNEGDITFSNTTPITWGTTASFTALANRNITIATGGTNALSNTGAGTINLRADSDATLSGGSFGTVTFTSGKINSSGGGFINIYYNPAAFTSALNPYTASITGNATVRQYMLVYNAAKQAAHDLNTIAGNTSTWNRSYALAENITALTLTNPIGSAATAFSGIFTGYNSVLNDGSNYTISNLTVTSANQYTGLFGSVGLNAGQAGRLENISLINPIISSSYNIASSGATGAIAGRVFNIAHLAGNLNVTVTGGGTASVTTTGVGGNVGGLFGIIGASTNLDPNSTFSNTVVSGTLTVTSAGGNNLGGLIGVVTGGINTATDFSAVSFTNNATVTATGAITGIGGIFGSFAKAGLTMAATMTNNGVIRSNYNLVPDITISSMGGIVGIVSANSTFNGSMTNTGTVGTAIGSGPGIVTVDNVGGLVGTISRGTYAGNLSSSGNVSGNTNVGGLIGVISNATISGVNGFNDLTITNAIAVTGTGSVGGLIGSLGGSTVISRTGTASTVAGTTVTGSSNAIGGLFGFVTGGATTNDFGFTILTNNATVTATNTLTGIGGIFGIINKSGLTITANMTNNGVVRSNYNLAPDMTITSMGGIIGTITGNNTFNGSMTNTATVGTAIGAGPGIVTVDNVGGLVGVISAGIFAGDMANSANVSGSSTVGGLIGNINSATLSGANGFNDLTITSPIAVTGTTRVGGLIGTIGASAVISRTGTASTAAGTTVTGSSNAIGGLFGFVTGGIVTANDLAFTTLTNNATVSASDTLTGIGGIFGNFAKTGLTITANMTNHGVIRSNYNLAPDITITSMGGIIGVISGDSILNGSMTNTATVGTAIGSGPGIVTTNSVGGLVGTISAGTYAGDMANSANVSGNTNVGGLIGSISGPTSVISNANGFNDLKITSAIAVTGTGSVGGLIGNIGGFTVISRTGTASTVAGTTVTGAGLNVGGLFGTITGGITAANDFAFTTLTNNATVTATTGTVNGIGGIFGRFLKVGLTVTADMTNHGIIQTNSAAAMTVIGMGGIGGSVNVNSTFTGSMNNTGSVGAGIGTGVITLTSVGGIFGSAVGTYSNTLTNTGAIQGGDNTAGIMGVAISTVLSGSYINHGNVTGTGTGTAGVIASITSNTGTGTFSNDGNISGVNNVGGIFATLATASLASATLNVAGSVHGTGTNVAGFLALLSDASTIPTNITNHATVTGTGTNVGGVIGFSNGVTLSGIFSNLSNITGTMDVGGIIGNMTNTTMTNHFFGQGNITGTTNVGGLIGTMNNSTLLESNFEGNVTGTTNVGGIAGILVGGTIDRVYSNVAFISGANNVGGIVGNSSGIISNVLFGGVTQLNGGANAGGLVGINTGTINTSLAVGLMSGTGSNKGALVGDNNAGTLNNPFYSVNTYEGIGVIGSGSPGSSHPGDYLTLTNAATFTPFGWQFPTIWSEVPGHYVALTWCGSSCHIIDPGYPSTYLNGLSVVERMLNQTQMLQYEDDTNFHTYLVGLFIQTVHVPCYPFDILVASLHLDVGITPFQLAIQALNFMSAQHILVAKSSCDQVKPKAIKSRKGKA